MDEFLSSMFFSLFLSERSIKTYFKDRNQRLLLVHIYKGLLFPYTYKLFYILTLPAPGDLDCCFCGCHSGAFPYLGKLVFSLKALALLGAEVLMGAVWTPPPQVSHIVVASGI